MARSGPMVTTTTMRPPVLVVRPSGIWNSRAPLHDFFRNSLVIGRDYGILTLAVTRVRHEIDHAPKGNAISPREFMRARSSGQIAGRAWLRYRDAWRALSDRR